MGAKLDSPLSAAGIALAHAKGAALKAAGYTPTKVYSSQLLRAKQTLAIILEELGITLAAVELADLNERDFGVYDGKPYKYVLEALEKYGDTPPTFEPTEAFTQRVCRALDEIKQATDGTTLVVSHSNPVMVMQTVLEEPDRLAEFWYRGDPPYCEGFEHTL